MAMQGTQSDAGSNCHPSASVVDFSNVVSFNDLISLRQGIAFSKIAAFHKIATFNASQGCCVHYPCCLSSVVAVLLCKVVDQVVNIFESLNVEGEDEVTHHGAAQQRMQ